VNKTTLKTIRALVFAIFGLFFFSEMASSATVIIQNNDASGEGFNDPTSVATLPGNPATTLGGQRLNSAQAAANAWGAVLTSPVTIVVRMNFDPLSCNASIALLGQAGPANIWRDFVGAPNVSTWYPQALANSLAGSHLDSGSADIGATFNSSIDNNNNCLNGTDWWYGIGSPAVTGTIDFFRVLLHEMGHGLGFLTLVDTATGTKAFGFDDAYMLNLEDHSLGRTWPSMSDTQRAASAIDTGDLHWVGNNVISNSSVLSGGVVSGGHVRMYAPSPREPGSSVSHWDTVVTPNELMEPFATPDAEDLITYRLFRDIGWTISGPVDGKPINPPPSDDNFLLDTIPPILAATAGKIPLPPTPVAPQWGVSTNLCCSTSSTTYGVTQGSQYRSSTLSSCSGSATFNGYLATSAGSKFFSHRVTSNTCPTLTGQGSFNLLAGKRYLWVAEYNSGNPRFVLYSENISSKIKNLSTGNLSSNTPAGMGIEASGPLFIEQGSGDGQSSFQPITRPLSTPP